MARMMPAPSLAANPAAEAIEAMKPALFHHEM
jgi:hypothetical protein